MKHLKVYTAKLGKAPRAVGRYWRKNWWHKILLILISLIVLLVGAFYGVAQWYTHSGRSQPYQLGVSFIPAYAESLGLNAQDTMDGLINDLGVRHFRLVSYWDQLEPSQGQYDFSLLDWQFQKAEAAHATISLSVGLRQPRWPECHMPGWASGEDANQWTPQLRDFIAATVNRYKHSPSLDSYQIENEYFLQGFGTCTNFDRQRLVDEYNLVKKLDPHHTLIVNRSNNALGLPLGQPQPDEFGISIYKRAWDANVTKRYLEYPFPAWFYAGLAGVQKIVTGKDMLVHEMQAEAWAPNGKTIPEISLAEQNKSLNAQRLNGRFNFAHATGMRQVYMWGAEYWYYRLTVLHDPTVWQTAQQNFKTAQQKGY